MRDQQWLENVLEKIWSEHFSDIYRINPIQIRFGKISRRRLGSIYLSKEEISIITLSGIFKDERVPDVVLYETIAHELIHYIHGFSSKVEKSFKNPHQGGIIEKEMDARGLTFVYTSSKDWMRENWVKFVNENYPLKRKKRRSRKPSLVLLMLKKRR